MAPYPWRDAAWREKRRREPLWEGPLNIYEVHIGSWKRHGDAPQGEPDEYGNYPGFFFFFDSESCEF